MNRSAIFYLLLFIVLSCDTPGKFESPADNYFVKFYGEDGNHEGVDFIANDDGTFILLGNENVPGSPLGQQIYVVKVDAQGMVIGEPRSFGGINDDYAKDIELTSDGNIIIAGETLTGPENHDVFILKIANDASLTKMDSTIVSGVLKTVNGSESDDLVNSISVISDGYIVAGSTTALGLRQTETTPPPIKAEDTKDALHLRFNANLDLIEQNTGLWFYTTGKDDGEDVLIKMVEVNPSTFYGFGYSNTPVLANNGARNFNYWAFSINNKAVPNGYDEIFVSSTSENKTLSNVIISPIQLGDGYVLSGIKTNSFGEDQSYILKLGNPLVQGQNNVLNEESPTDLGVSVGSRTAMTTLFRGGYLLLANNNQPPSDNLNISLIKLSSTFKKEWQEQILFGGVGDDFSGSVAELPDGKIMIIGTMTLGGGQTKMVLMKLNSQGRLID